MTDPMGGREPSRDRASTGAQLVVPRAGSRGLVLGGMVVAAFLLLAVLKPWGGTGGSGQPADPDRPSGEPGEAAASADPTPMPSAVPPGLGMPGGQCFAGTEWRVFASEVNDGRSVRHWLSIEPDVAVSPRDRKVRFVRVVTDRVLALGFCVGSGPDGPTSLVGTRAWTLSGGTAVPLVLAPMAAYMPSEPDLGAVYRPPAESPATTPGTSPAADAGAWPPGRYVFAIRQASVDGDEQWFGVEIVAARREASTP